MIEDLIQSILAGDFLLALFNIILAVVSGIVSVILWPFGVLIEAFLPELNTGLESISQIYTYASTYLSWILNAVGIPAVAITMIAAYYIFSFTITFTAWSLKLLLKWKKAIW